MAFWNVLFYVSKENHIVYLNQKNYCPFVPLKAFKLFIFSKIHWPTPSLKIAKTIKTMPWYIYFFLIKLGENLFQQQKNRSKPSIYTLKHLTRNNLYHTKKKKHYMFICKTTKEILIFFFYKHLCFYSTKL